MSIFHTYPKTLIRSKCLLRCRRKQISFDADQNSYFIDGPNLASVQPSLKLTLACTNSTQYVLILSIWIARLETNITVI